MLAALALVLLVFSVTEGRILSKCELKEQLEAAQIQQIRSMGDTTTVDKLITRLDLDRGNVIAVNAGVTEPSDFIKNILICVLKMNEGLTGVERHEVVCNVENTSGFNTSLVTSVQINQDEIRPPFQIPPKPKNEKPPAKEEDDQKMEDEHIIPVQPQSHPKGRHGRSVPESKSFEILFPEKVPTDSSGSGSEALSEEDSSGDSSEEERDDVIAWNLLGIFQLSDRVACDSGSSGSLNLCGLECSALINDDITDDIACLKTLAGSHGKFSGFNPKKRFLTKMLAVVLVKECRSVVPSKYFAECS